MVQFSPGEVSAYPIIPLTCCFPRHLLCMSAGFYRGRAAQECWRHSPNELSRLLSHSLFYTPPWLRKSQIPGSPCRLFPCRFEREKRLVLPWTFPAFDFNVKVTATCPRARATSVRIFDIWCDDSIPNSTSKFISPMTILLPSYKVKIKSSFPLIMGKQGNRT